jgi:hypothetical protein
VEYAFSLPALESISKYNPDAFSIENIKELLDLVYYNKYTASASWMRLENRIEKNNNLINYLKGRLHRILGEQEAEKTINNILQRVFNRRNNLNYFFLIILSKTLLEMKSKNIFYD